MLVYNHVNVVFLCVHWCKKVCSICGTGSVLCLLPVEADSSVQQNANRQVKTAITCLLLRARSIPKH